MMEREYGRRIQAAMKDQRNLIGLLTEQEIDALYYYTAGKSFPKTVDFQTLQDPPVQALLRSAQKKRNRVLTQARDRLEAHQVALLVVYAVWSLEIGIGYYRHLLSTYDVASKSPLKRFWLGFEGASQASNQVDFQWPFDTPPPWTTDHEETR